VDRADGAFDCDDEGVGMHQIHSGTAVFRTASDGRIAEWNPEAERLTGITAGEATGRPCWDVIAGRDADGGLLCHPGCSTARLAREGWPVRSVEAHLRTPSGIKRLLVSTIVLGSGDSPTILHTMHEAVDSAMPAAEGGAHVLTPRQREILVLLAQGIRAREIATILTLSETTVRNHIQAILMGLGVHSQLEAVARARTLTLADHQPAA
jgi:DNA-binding CsgD family transcriptional regulator